MSLNALPNETVLNILGHFKNDTEDRKALAALSRSSRRLHALATPFLYHTPFPDLKNDGTYPTAFTHSLCCSGPS